MCEKVWVNEGGLVVKTACNVGDHLQCRRPRFSPGVRKICWRRKWQPTPVLLPGKPHGERSLEGHSPWGCQSRTQLSNQTTTTIMSSGHQFSSVTQSCLTLCDPMNHSMPGLPVYIQLPELTQTHAHRVGDAIQPSHPLSSASPPALNPSQHQGLFQWVSSSHEVAKVLEFQLQHQFLQWTPRTDLL